MSETSATQGKKAVILSGGLGTRLKPFTDAIPKPLLPVGEKAVLEIQIERLARAGFEEIYLATNYKSSYIERFFGDGSDYGVKLFVSKERQALGTAGPLSLLRAQLSDAPFLVMNGDILTLMDFAKMYDFACDRGAAFTAGVKKIVTPFAFGDIKFDGDRITSVLEKPDIVSYALAGIYVLSPAALSYIPDNTYFGIDDLLHAMLRQGDPVLKYEIEEYWLDIGRVGDFEKAQKDYLEAEEHDHE